MSVNYVISVGRPSVILEDKQCVGLSIMHLLSSSKENSMELPLTYGV